MWTACNSINSLFFIHTSKIHIHLSFTTIVRVFFRTDFQLPGWFLLKKFSFKSLCVNCCTKAILWLHSELCVWVDKKINLISFNFSKLLNIYYYLLEKLYSDSPITFYWHIFLFVLHYIYNMGKVIYNVGKSETY